MRIAIHSEGSRATTSSLTSLSFLLHRLHQPEQDEACPSIAHDPAEKLLSLLTSSRALETGGLRVVDVEELSTHGGSLRVHAVPAEAAHDDAAARDDEVA